MAECNMIPNNFSRLFTHKKKKKKKHKSVRYLVNILF